MFSSKCETLALQVAYASEMNRFRFFKSNPAFHFKIHVQIPKQTAVKSKSCLNPEAYLSFVSLHVIQLNMIREKIFASLFKLVMLYLCFTTL